MPRVLWPNGHVDRARSWDDLLEKVRRTQVRDIAPEEFRIELAERAWVWNHNVVDPFCSARDLFEQLELAKMCKIISDNPKERKGN